ncbi:MAG: NERD domain-containing protein, partial [Caryophanon sp.]|nr:NERD domain-containing protein [Caryophanon sp.]
MPFFETELLGKPGETGEKKVWDAIKQAYREQDQLGKCVGYWRYPLFTKVGQQRKEPDILIADQDYGVIIVEVKSIKIEQLVAVNGHLWEYRDFYEKSGNPYQQAENQLYSLLSVFDREPQLRRNIPGKVLIALPYINEKDWIEHGFDRLPGVPPIIFGDKLGRGSMLQTIAQAADTQRGDAIDADRWRLLLSILSGSPIHIKEVSLSSADGSTKYGVIQTLTSKLSEMDIQQEGIGKTIPPGPQRIRGIAGSGKSVLLCQKAAHMHLKHPDWNIALVFFSRSLYEEVTNQVDKWLRHFSNGDVCYDDTVKQKLKILHAWGGANRPGFYSLACNIHGVRPLTVNDILNERIFGMGNSIGYICGQLLHAVPNINPFFDAILVDEGQDLMVTDNYKYKDKQPFYWLAYNMLKPVDEGDRVNRRLIWAYDESQSLDNLTIPTSRELFGADEAFKLFVTGNHKGGAKKSEVMHRCYRTPGPILTAAHAIGMGLLRPDGMLRGITNKEDWKSIGYDVIRGSFRQGETITLQRPEKNSPNLVPTLWKEPVLHFNKYGSRQEELHALAQAIQSNITKDGLTPHEHILVVVLGAGRDAAALQGQVANALQAHRIDYYIPSMRQSNILTAADYREKNPDKFK